MAWKKMAQQWIGLAALAEDFIQFSSQTLIRRLTLPITQAPSDLTLFSSFVGTWKHVVGRQTDSNQVDTLKSKQINF